MKKLVNSSDKDNNNYSITEIGQNTEKSPEDLNRLAGHSNTNKRLSAKAGVWCSWYSHIRIDTRTGGLENKRTSGDYSNYCIIEICQNTEKSPGDLRKLAVTQTSVKGHQPTLI